MGGFVSCDCKNREIVVVSLALAVAHISEFQATVSKAEVHIRVLVPAQHTPAWSTRISDSKYRDKVVESVFDVGGLRESCICVHINDTFIYLSLRLL